MREKTESYAEATQQIIAITQGEQNLIAVMATCSCILATEFPENIWTGFYIVDKENPNELVVGPYQGTIGCLRILMGKGVCGTAAQTGVTQVISDVHEFPGHIACDSRSASEIVVPVYDAERGLIAVLDIDNPRIGAFDNIDKIALESLVEKVFGK